MGTLSFQPRFDVEGERFVTRDGVMLPLRVFAPTGAEAPRAVVLALHGFNDYSNAFTGAGAYMAARGVALYAYDQRGFGETDEPGIWAGGSALVADARDALAILRESHPDTPLYVLGESMGGAVSLLALTGPGAAEVDGAILVAPAIWGRDVMNPLQRLALRIAYNTVPGMELTGEGLGIVPTDNRVVLRQIAEDPNFIKSSRVDAIDGLVSLMSDALDRADEYRTPSLVLYGENEQVLPKPAIRRFLRSLPNPGHRVAIYEDGYHMLLRDLQGEVVLDDILAWLDAPDRSLPSGADRLDSVREFTYGAPVGGRL